MLALGAPLAAAPGRTRRPGRPVSRLRHVGRLAADAAEGTTRSVRSSMVKVPDNQHAFLLFG
jgi:hypothetical protein